MADSPSESKSKSAPAAAARWWRWLLRLASVLGAVAVGAVVGLLVAPTPGTLLLQELRHDDWYASLAGVGAWRGQPVVVRLPDRALRRPLTVRRLVDGVALPVPVSALTWERPPDLLHSFGFADNRVTVVEPPIALHVGDTRQRSPDGGRDCISEVPLDGGPAVRRCHSPSLKVLAMGSPYAAGGIVYYSGSVLNVDRFHELGEPVPFALVAVGADGTWRELDRVSDVPDGTAMVGNILHDSDAIYWSTGRQVRRVSRKDGSVRTVFHTHNNPVISLPLRIAMVGRTLVVAANQRKGKNSWTFPVYAMDPTAETHASTATPLAMLDFFVAPHLELETDGEAVYLFDHTRLKRLTLDGHITTLARREEQAHVEDMALVGDRIVYLATDMEGSPRYLKVWSVPK